MRPLLESLHVLRLKALRPLDDIELYSLAFLQATEAVAADSREVHENIGPSLTADKAETFGIVEPFHCSLFHCLIPIVFLNFCREEPLLLERVTLKRGTNCQMRGIELSQISVRCAGTGEDSEFLSRRARTWRLAQAFRIHCKNLKRLKKLRVRGASYTACPAQN